MVFLFVFLGMDFFLASSTSSSVISIGRRELVAPEAGWGWLSEASTGGGAGCGSSNAREEQEGLPFRRSKVAVSEDKSCSKSICVRMASSLSSIAAHSFVVQTN